MGFLRIGSDNLMLDLISNVFLDLHLVLDKGDAQNFDQNWEVAQCLSQPEAFGVGHVLSEHAAD